MVLDFYGDVWFLKGMVWHGVNFVIDGLEITENPIYFRDQSKSQTQIT